MSSAMPHGSAPAEAEAPRSIDRADGLAAEMEADADVEAPDRAEK